MSDRYNPAGYLGTVAVIKEANFGLPSICVVVGLPSSGRWKSYVSMVVLNDTSTIQTNMDVMKNSSVYYPKCFWKLQDLDRPPLLVIDAPPYDEDNGWIFLSELWLVEHSRTIQMWVRRLGSMKYRLSSPEKHETHPASRIRCIQTSATWIVLMSNWLLNMH